MKWLLDRKNYVIFYVIGYLVRGIIYHFFPLINEIMTAITILWPLLILGNEFFKKEKADRFQWSLFAFLVGATVSTLVNFNESTPDAWLSLWQIVSLFLLFSVSKYEEYEAMHTLYRRLAAAAAIVIVLLASGSMFLLACYSQNIVLPGNLASADKLFTYGHMGGELRFCGMFGYSADGGNLCALAFVLCLYLLEEKIIRPWMAAIGCVILFVTIWFLDVRTTLVELGVVGLLLLYRFLSKKAYGKKAIAAMLGVMAVLVLAVFVLKKDAILSMIQKIQSDPENTLRFLTTGRSIYWIVAWRGFLSHPLFGYGWINNTHMWRMYFDSHNLLFNLMFWTGLAGLVPLAVFTFHFLKRMVKTKPGWTMMAILPAAVLTESMFDRAVLGTANTGCETSFFWLTLGFLTYYSGRKDKTDVSLIQ